MNHRPALRRLVVPAGLALVLAACATPPEDPYVLPAPTGGPEPVAEAPAVPEPAPAEPAPDDGTTADSANSEKR
jgi:hypothetical protein